MNKTLIKLFGTWYPYIKPIETNNYMMNTMSFMNQQYKDHYVYPKKRDVFKIFNKVKFNDVKVVVLGGYPYDNGQANGVAFSSNYSLINSNKTPYEIYQISRNIENNVYGGVNLDFDTTLEDWLKQGVFPLHLAMTGTREDREAYKVIWQNFLMIVVRAISEYNNGVVFLLLGEDAEKCRKYINEKSSYIVSASYPKGKNIVESWNDSCFNKVNEILIQNNKEQIIW